MKEHIHRKILFVLLFCILLTIPALADMGPKSSVQVDFEGLGDRMCYATLLSETSSTGPYSEGNEVDSDEEIHNTFKNYQDPDGFHYISYLERVDQSGQLKWTYCPPERFKILLYFPDTDSYAVSQICERYAFHSRFRVVVDSSALTESGTVLQVTAKKSYQYRPEIVNLVIRLLVTILLEFSIALLFGFKQKALLKLIAITNIITQLFLNWLLLWVHIKAGYLRYLILGVFFFEDYSHIFLMGEITVFLVEALVYIIGFRKITGDEDLSGRACAYAATANLTSMIVGILIVFLFPSVG